MPSVLLLCEYPTLSGGERSMLATFDQLVTAGWVPVVAAPAEGALAEALQEQGIPLWPFPPQKSDRKSISQQKLRLHLGQLLRRQRPDLLHANSLSMGRLAGPVAASLRLPSIAHLRDIVRLSRRAIADVNCNTRLLAVSEATRRFHLAAGLAPQKLHVLYNGVDLTRFHPCPASGYLHRLLGLAPGTFLVGTIGQIGPRKGHDVLVRSALAIAARRSDVHFLVVGCRFSRKDESRTFEADLRRAAAGPLRGRLHLLGYRHDVPQILPELSLLVHPARQEPLGRVLLESAAAGVPVVATDVGGNREIFPPESASALLLPPDDSQALAETIVQLLDHPAMRSQLAAAARRRAEEAFDLHMTTAQLLDHYQETVAG